ncbi:HEPN family nuclease [Lyngbya confervoides]|uniref:HEPN family nuclease n=1 Tax=Lyngbya confervoides BDU141951 TaxID=1574623 RepID=A0ABD4TA98_9CYAN|nr:HEPN family nuclease [Lyngbya confervoides]MCM1985279.1 HEPN family nuclease [Lyngbya confervoides BDU141951]
MSTELTQEENLLFQSYYTFSLLTELHNNNLLESEYYDGMVFGVPQIKDDLRSIGIDNQGCVLIALYVMLVIPKEIVQQKYSSEYDSISQFLRTHTQNTSTTYSSDKTIVNFLRHIRNAVAHARVEFRPNDVVIFSDANNKNESFSTELPLRYLGEFVNQLQKVHIAYSQDWHQQGS